MPVEFLVFVGNYLGWSRPRVQIAKAAIAGEYITQMVARLECGVLAVPVHSTGANVYHRAPGRVTKSSAGRSSKRCRRGKSSDTKYQFRQDFQHDEPFVSLLGILNKHRNSAESSSGQCRRILVSNSVA
jgi:hypothetical protein